MLSKHGFGDGDNMPIGIEYFREAYVAAINTIAARLGSKFRAVAHNRPGMHNWCFIVIVPTTVPNRQEGEFIEHNDCVTADAAFGEAINICNELNIDDCVKVITAVDRPSLDAKVQAAISHCQELADTLKDPL
jgi:hypothetical protein